jgi:protein-tyrosine-phosphatase
MAEKVYNVLFLCTGNSARSIIAEALLEHWGKAGSKRIARAAFPKALCTRWRSTCSKRPISIPAGAQQELGRIRETGRA